MAPDDKSVSTPIASWRLILVQDSPGTGSAPGRERERTQGPEAERVYPSYKVRFFGPGIPTGSGTTTGVATCIGPHTCAMVVDAGKYEITLGHNDHDNDENPDLIVNFNKVG